MEHLRGCAVASFPAQPAKAAKQAIAMATKRCNKKFILEWFQN
jgi:hypothetical protein